MTSFSKFGFEKRENFFTIKEIDIIKREIELIIKQKSSYEYYEDEILVRIENFVDLSQKLKEVLLSNKVLNLVGEFFENLEPILFKDKLNFKKFGSRPDLLHQDIQAPWDKYGFNNFVTLGIPLDVCEIDNSCLWFLKEERKIYSDCSSPLEMANFKKESFVPMIMSPGDVSVHDAYAVHHSEKQKSYKSRRIIFLTFNKKSDGDFRKEYYRDKIKSYPPNNMRIEGVTYEYKV